MRAPSVNGPIAVMAVSNKIIAVLGRITNASDILLDSRMAWMDDLLVAIITLRL